MIARMAATTGRPVKVAVGVTPRLRSYLFFAPLMLAFAGSSVFGEDCLTANLSTRVRLGVHIHIQLPGRKLHRLFGCQYGLSPQWAISWTALLRKPYDDRPLGALRSGSVTMGHSRRLHRGHFLHTTERHPYRHWIGVAGDRPADSREKSCDSPARKRWDCNQHMRPPIFCGCFRVS